MPFRYTLAEEHFLSAEESIRCELLKQKFSYIIDTYLSPNSPQEINIHYDMRQSILEQWQSHGCYHPAIFDSARKSILELMRVNSFIPWVSQIKQALPQHPLDASPTRSSTLFLLRKSVRSSNSSIGSEEEEDIDDDGSTDRPHHYSTSAFFKRFTASPWKAKEQKDSSSVDTQETEKPSRGSPHLYNAFLPRRPLSSPVISKSSSSSTENVNVSESKSWTWRKGSTKG
jgi:hypothetical protein